MVNQVLATGPSTASPITHSETVQHEFSLVEPGSMCRCQQDLEPCAIIGLQNRGRLSHTATLVERHLESGSIFDLSDSALALCVALVEIFVVRLQDALTVESPGFRVGPQPANRSNSMREGAG